MFFKQVTQSHIEQDSPGRQENAGISLVKVKKYIFILLHFQFTFLNQLSLKEII